jgi:hypothetical protein
MNKVAVDIKKARAIGLRLDDVVVPDLIVECSCHGFEPFGLTRAPHCFADVLGSRRAESKAPHWECGKIGAIRNVFNGR